MAAQGGEKRLGLRRRVQMAEEPQKSAKKTKPFEVSKRLYNVGDFSPYNLIWESTLPKETRDRYKKIGEEMKGMVSSQAVQGSASKAKQEPMTQQSAGQSSRPKGFTRTQPLSASRSPNKKTQFQVRQSQNNQQKLARNPEVSASQGMRIIGGNLNQDIADDIGKQISTPPSKANPGLPPQVQPYYALMHSQHTLRSQHTNTAGLTASFGQNQWTTLKHNELNSYGTLGSSDQQQMQIHEMPIMTNDVRQPNQQHQNSIATGAKKISGEAGQSQDRELQTTLIDDVSQEILVNDKETSVDLKASDVQLNRITPKAVVRQISKNQNLSRQEESILQAKVTPLLTKQHSASKPIPISQYLRNIDEAFAIRNDFYDNFILQDMKDLDQELFPIEKVHHADIYPAYVQKNFNAKLSNLKQKQRLQGYMDAHCQQSSLNTTGWQLSDPQATRWRPKRPQTSKPGVTGGLQNSRINVQPASSHSHKRFNSSHKAKETQKQPKKSLFSMFMKDMPIVQQAIQISASGKQDINITQPIRIEGETRRLLSALSTENLEGSVPSASGHIIFQQEHVGEPIQANFSDDMCGSQVPSTPGITVMPPTNVFEMQQEINLNNSLEIKPNHGFKETQETITGTYPRSRKLSNEQSPVTTAFLPGNTESRTNKKYKMSLKDCATPASVTDKIEKSHESEIAIYSRLEKSRLLKMQAQDYSSIQIDQKKEEPTITRSISPPRHSKNHSSKEKRMSSMNRKQSQEKSVVPVSERERHCSSQEKLRITNIQFPRRKSSIKGMATSSQTQLKLKNINSHKSLQRPTSENSPEIGSNLPDRLPPRQQQLQIPLPIPLVGSSSQAQNCQFLSTNKSAKIHILRHPSQSQVEGKYTVVPMVQNESALFDSQFAKTGMNSIPPQIYQQQSRANKQPSSFRANSVNILPKEYVFGKGISKFRMEGRRRQYSDNMHHSQGVVNVQIAPNNEASHRSSANNRGQQQVPFRKVTGGMIKISDSRENNSLPPSQVKNLQKPDAAIGFSNSEIGLSFHMQSQGMVVEQVSGVKLASVNVPSHLPQTIDSISTFKLGRLDSQTADAVNQDIRSRMNQGLDTRKSSLQPPREIKAIHSHRQAIKDFSKRTNDDRNHMRKSQTVLPSNEPSTILSFQSQQEAIYQK